MVSNNACDTKWLGTDYAATMMTATKSVFTAYQLQVLQSTKLSAALSAAP